MNKKIPYIITGAALLTALVGIGSAISMSSKNKAATSEILELQARIAHMQAAVPDVRPEPEIIYITNSSDTNEITELKSLLAEKEAQIRELRSDTNRPARRDPIVRQSFEERMIQMKAEDPEGYAEMIQRRSERQQEIRDNLDERTAAFMDLDTSMMTEEELADHELLVTKMEQLWEITGQFQDPEVAPDREAMLEMMAVTRDIRPLMAAERSLMFRQLGTRLGHEGEDAEAFATHIEDIIEVTSVQMSGGRGRGGP